MSIQLFKRFAMYIIGLFIMTIGIAFSVKSNLGVSPVSSIPYTMTCVWGIEMGRATILFHCILVLIQIVILRKNFKIINLLQVLVGIMFGYFTTFCNWGVSFLPTPDNIAIRLGLSLISIVLVAIGIFFYMPPDIMPLAGEGAMKAVSDVTGIEFPKVKIGFDVTMVVISLTTCLISIHSFGSVGIGTVIAAVLVGTVLGFISKRFGAARDKWLFGGNVVNTTESSSANGISATTDGVTGNYVITIAREYGSGGREIGRLVAEKLGIAYYDLAVIQKVAEEMGLSEQIIEANDQALKNPVTHALYYWYAQSGDNNDSTVAEKIFNAQQKVIREIASTESCVIVGRLANYILRDKPDVFNVFVGADMSSKIERVVAREDCDEKQAARKIEKVERERTNHCMYFTHTHWKDLSNYDLYIKSNILGTDKTADTIIEIAKNSFNA